VRNNLPAAQHRPDDADLVQLAVQHVLGDRRGRRRADRRLQWQVNSTSGQCTVELRLDDVGFIPASAPPEPAGDDGGTGDAARPTDHQPHPAALLARGRSLF
jgi:hypothetical protein